MCKIKEYEKDMDSALAKRGLAPLYGRDMAEWAAAHVPTRYVKRIPLGSASLWEKAGLTESETNLLVAYCRTGGEILASDKNGNLFLATFSEAYCSWIGEKGSYVPAGVSIGSMREADLGTVCATALRQSNRQVRRLRRMADAEEPGEDRETYEEELMYTEADRETLRALAKKIRRAI